MAYKLKLQDLQNALDTFAKSNPELKEVTLHNSDIRCGKRVALVKVAKHGAIHLLTDYMLYSEMNQFLRGYYFKSENKFEREIKNINSYDTI